MKQVEQKVLFFFTLAMNSRRHHLCEHCDAPAVKPGFKDVFL